MSKSCDKRMKRKSVKTMRTILVVVKTQKYLVKSVKVKNSAKRNSYNSYSESKKIR